MTATSRITVLAENTAQGAGLLGEHGLAYWIEWNEKRVLLDTGQGSVLVGNAYKLGVPLREADALVLSHGHYDHTGGLPDALRGDRPFEVFLHPAAMEPKFARDRNRSPREIGMPFPAQKAVRKASVRVQTTEAPTAVADRLLVTGPVPRVTDFEDTGGSFFLDQRCSKPDPLIDDQAMFFDSGGGTVVLLGCAHSGVINTLRYVRELTGGKPICAVLGGMHLVQASPERVVRTIEELRQWDVSLLAPAHCTGMAATTALWGAFPGRCAPCGVGSRFTFQCP